MKFSIRAFSFYIILLVLLAACVQPPTTLAVVTQARNTTTPSVTSATASLSPTSTETAAPQPTITVSPQPTIHLPGEDQIIFTIPNPESFRGREGEERPDWLAWGAETFALAPDGSFWIADTAVSPQRLLHYSGQGELLNQFSLQDTVFFAYDLLAMEDRVWVLDTGSLNRLVAFSLEGEIQSTIEIPQEITMFGGNLVANGISSLMSSESGEIILHGVNGYHLLKVSADKIKAQPLAEFTYFGHTYWMELFDLATGMQSFRVDGERYALPPDFHAEDWLGFNPDGSFALAGYFQEGEMSFDPFMLYFAAEGQLLGLARQRPQTIYRSSSHHLAFGPDGAVYQLLSNPDHSVQIVRLGFSSKMPPKNNPPTPTVIPLTPLKPAESAASAEEQARNALLAFFYHLDSQQYADAAALFGGEANQSGRVPQTGESLADFLQSLCTTQLFCLPIAEVTETMQVSENEFLFYVVFVNKNGTRLEGGACCGGDPAATPAIWQFAYPVEKIDGAWKVMRLPLYFP